MRVPGTAQSELDDARTAALLNWLLHEFSAAEIPPGFAPYDAGEIAPLRRAPLSDVWGTRNELLRVLAAQPAAPAQAPARAP